jgi:hypothetical protein
MIMTCELCGNEFLTEADPYVVRNTPQGQKYYCSCMIINHDQVSGIDKLQAENKKLREALEFTLKAAEQMFRPDKELLQGLCPTMYHTLSYSGDLELIMKTKDARKLLDSIKE